MSQEIRYYGKAYRTLELPVEVLGSKAADVHRHIRQQHVRQQLPILQHGVVQQGFQDAARAAGRTDHVDLIARLSVVEPHIAAIRHG